MKSKHITIINLLALLVLLSNSGCRPALPESSHRESSTPLPARTATGEASTATAVQEVSPEATPALPGLTFDQFLEESFKQLMLRDPEWVAIEGLEERLGVSEMPLTNYSDAYIQETQALHRSILETLHGYDRSSLTYEQQIAYDAYAWHLDDLVRQQEFINYDYPVNQLSVLGMQLVTEYLFTDIYPVKDKESAEAYIRRLSEVDDKFAQVIEGMKRREQAGVIPPRRVLEMSLPDIQMMGKTPPNVTSYCLTLRDKLAPLSSVTPAKKAELLENARKEVESSVLPAYEALANYLEDLLSRAPAEDGVWQYPNGDEYYRYALRHHTSTDLTPDEVHEMGLRELERIHAEMRVLFDQLGYPQDANLTRLYSMVAQDSGKAYDAQIMTGFQDLIDEASGRLDEAFDLHPRADVIVKDGPPGPAFYMSPAYDGSRPGIFYAPTSGVAENYRMPTLAYHEAIPGHHFQVAIARELDLPLFLNIAQFNSYVEGWALYAERLASELGWYAGNPYADLGRLQYEAYRAARLVVDTGVHAKRWSFTQGVDFITKNTGLPRAAMDYEVARFIAWPGQATSYAIGYLKILELRQRAQDHLGDRFDLKAFHNIVLRHGGLPLDVLEHVVNDYLTLASLEKVGDYPFYTMRYSGDYGFSQYLDAKEAHVISLLPSSFVSGSLPPSPFVSGSFPPSPFVSGCLPPSPFVSGSFLPSPFGRGAGGEVRFACTCFAALSSNSDMLFGRNFDWYRHPALLLFTDPPDAYASVSMVDISYLGYSAGIPLADSGSNAIDYTSLGSLLQAPYLPFDGMNEKGLAVGMMAIDHAEGGNNPRKATIDELELIRLMLDSASTVDKAIALLPRYNIDLGSVPIHYLIADRGGHSAVIEFIDGEARILRSDSPWQVSTNFLFADEHPKGADSSCWRYNTAYSVLEDAGGLLTQSQALSLLESVSQTGSYPTIWSMVYNMTVGKVQVVMDRQYNQPFEFHLEMQP